MSTTGHEEEFRALFAQEAEERLNNLDALLLQLEQTPNDAELVASLFREAHTMKGGAAVVGLDEIALVAHAMEDRLESVRSGGETATPELVDVILRAVDGLRELLALVLDGNDGAEQAAALEAQLRASGTETVHDFSDSGSDVSGSGSDAGPDRDSDGAPGRSAGHHGDRSATDDAAAGVTATPPSEEPARGPEPVESVRVPLTRLDELARLVGESAAAHLRVGRLLGLAMGVDPGSVDEVRELSTVLNELQELTMRSRMVPVATVTDVLHRAVRDVSRSTGKKVRWDVRGEDTELDRGVLQQLADPLLHIVRNAVDHGIEAPADRIAAGKPEQGIVRFHAMQLGSEVILTITDDGRGIDVNELRAHAARRDPEAIHLDDDEALYLVFRSGFSTATFVSDISGRGVGLDVVRANVDAVRGRIEIRTEPGLGSEFRVIVPITLAVLPCLLVEAGGRRHAIPMHSVVVAQAEGAEVNAEGRQSILFGSQAVPLSSLAATLGLPPDDTGPIVVVTGLTRRHAFRVAELVGQRDVVVKGLSRLLPRLDVLAGASIEPDGSIMLVLDVAGVIDRARIERHRVAAASPTRPVPPPRSHRAKILVVDDALTVRELQRSILERAGYEVVVAIDGVDGLSRFAEGQVDLVLTDVEMPRMDGFELTKNIRAHPTNGNVPVLILTSLATDDARQRGLQAGADGYIVKSAFDEAGLIDAVERLLVP